MTAPLSLPPSLDAPEHRAAIEAHLVEGHRRLGGQIDHCGPLRLFSNTSYDWTFFNTARLAQPAPDGVLEPLIDHVLDYYQARGLRPAWDVSQAWAPPTLAPRLTASGFTLDRYETLMGRLVGEEGREQGAGDKGQETGGTGRETTDDGRHTTDSGAWSIARGAWSAVGGRWSSASAQPAVNGRWSAASNPSSPVDNGVTIRPLVAEELDYFVTAWRAGFAIGSDTNLIQVRSLFTRDLAAGWQFWCAWRDGRAVGTLADLSIDRVVQIANVSTVPGARRHGVATRLVQACLKRAEARGERLIYLHAATGSAAERLYRRLGFEELDTWLTYVHEPVMMW